MGKLSFFARSALIIAIIACTAFCSGAKADSLQDGLSAPYSAPEFGGLTWLNSKPLTMSELKGKVVLVDFWTYSCINCLRTLSHITEWDKKYRDKGLVIIGIHAPEFAFEKDANNVKQALAKYGINYPVAQDNDGVTWNNFNNQYWPAHYLISKEGKVVYTHFGEGNYDKTENNIRYLLGLKGPAVSGNKGKATTNNQSPETYLGYDRSQNYIGEKIGKDKNQNYKFPNLIPSDSWSLQGDWKIEPERIISGAKDASLRFNFTAGKVYLVLGSNGKTIDVDVKLNGKSVNSFKVDSHKLYEIASQPQVKNSLLEVTASDAGLEAYAFTFGK